MNIISFDHQIEVTDAVLVTCNISQSMPPVKNHDNLYVSAIWGAR